MIGFPASPRPSMEQGRLAALARVRRARRRAGELLPIGIYTIPEISFVGKTEEELTEAGVPVRGRHLALPRARPRRRSLGDSHGMLKLLVSLDDRTLLGVHVFGTGATELVHIGQAVMGCGGTVDYLVDTVFNYPTLAEAYKVAALDAQNRLQTLTDVGPLRLRRPLRAGSPARTPRARQAPYAACRARRCEGACPIRRRTPATRGRWGEHRMSVLQCGG